MQKHLSEDEALAAEPSDYRPPAEVPPKSKTGLLNDHVFERLVHDEEDVVGLLAYSLSMQNKRDWLNAFHQEVGREPTPSELAAYDIGERIDRRLATYRKLAEHALSGNAFWASATLTPVSELPGAPAVDPPSTPPAAGKSSWFGGSKSR
jgi:hypothetical protein